MSEQRLIKKYANRRLYDAAQSRHITIEDVRNMVTAGLRVKVIEDKSNEDITRLVLLQVITARIDDSVLRGLHAQLVQFLP